MRRLILVAASAVALGIGGVAMGYAPHAYGPASTSVAGPSVAMGYAPHAYGPASTSVAGPSSLAAETTDWRAGYGIPASPSQLARIQRQEQRYTQSVIFRDPRSLGNGAL
jgi:hypothetical protein